MDRVTTADGLTLHVQRWPAVGPSRGTVRIVHGLGEHIGRYAHVAAALNAAGWQVLGHDHRGHGRSEGPRGTLAEPHSLLADLACVIDASRAQAGPGPQVLLGHSLGGLVAARFAAEALQPTRAPWSRPLDGLVLSSPALAIALGPAQRGLLAVLAPLAPSLRIGNGLNPQHVSRDAAVVQAYRSDPLVHDRITPRLVQFMLQAGAEVAAAAPRWHLPTLLMWAEADRLVLPAGSTAFAAAAPAASLSARPWPGLAHEIFNEPEQAQVLAALLHWLDHRWPPRERTGPAPP